jgi:hypothetical protein
MEREAQEGTGGGPTTYSSAYMQACHSKVLVLTVAIAVSYLLPCGASATLCSEQRSNKSACGPAKVPDKEGSSRVYGWPSAARYCTAVQPYVHEPSFVLLLCSCAPSACCTLTARREVSLVSAAWALLLAPCESTPSCAMVTAQKLVPKLPQRLLLVPLVWCCCRGCCAVLCIVDAVTLNMGLKHMDDLVSVQSEGQDHSS